MKVSTGFGYWDALLFFFSFIVATLISFLILQWSSNRAPKYTNEDRKGRIFLSGEDEKARSSETLHVPSQTFAWGFRKGFEKYYKYMKNEYRGLLSDYTFYLFISLAIIIIVLFVWG